MSKKPKPAPDKAHWPRPNVARTHCLECGRHIAKHGDRGWIHIANPKGRPITGPIWPHIAQQAIDDYHHAGRLMIDAYEKQGECLIRMGESGMLAHQIADATGLSVGGVRAIFKELNQPLRMVTNRPSTAYTSLRRRGEKRGPLFGGS